MEGKSQCDFQPLENSSDMQSLLCWLYRRHSIHADERIDVVLDTEGTLHVFAIFFSSLNPWELTIEFLDSRSRDGNTVGGSHFAKKSVRFHLPADYHKP